MMDFCSPPKFRWPNIFIVTCEWRDKSPPKKYAFFHVIEMTEHENKNAYFDNGDPDTMAKQW